MKKTTIDRIVRNTLLWCDRMRKVHYTVIGKYAYSYDWVEKTIKRCSMDSLGRQWIEDDGTLTDEWQVIATNIYPA